MTAGCDDVRRAEADLIAELPVARSATETDTDAIARAVDEAILGTTIGAGSDRRLHALSDFGGLYVRQRGALIVHARRFLSDSHDIDDVVQETFLKLFLAMPEVETEGQALAFARRVLTNLCIDRYRAAQRRPITVDVDLGTADHLLAEDEPTDPVVQAEDAAIIREALARLSPLHRDALIKREIEEKPLPVIAEELGIPEESVKHLLFRARRMLRRLLVGTSVDPATPMRAPEVLSAANQRLARAALRSTNVIIAMMVAVVAVAGGLHGIHRAATTPPVTDGGPIGSLPAPSPHYPTLPRYAQQSHQPANDHASSDASAAPAVTPPVRKPAPPRQPTKTGSKPAPVNGNAAADAAVTALAQSLRGHFVVQAPDLGEVSPASVQTTSVESNSDGSQTNTSNLTADLGSGPLSLGQQVQMSSNGVVSANLTPSVPLADGSVATVTQSSNVTTLATPDGDTVVNVQLVVAAPSTAPSGTDSTGASPQASPATAIVTMQALFGRDLVQALGEQVVVTIPGATSTGTTPTGTTSGAPSPSGAETSAPPASDPSDNGAPRGSPRQITAR